MTAGRPLHGDRAHAEFPFFLLSIHGIHDKRPTGGSRGILGRFWQKKGWPMGLPGTDLNHRAAFLYARIGAALLALIACNAVAEAPALIAQDAWVREVPGSDVAAVYLTLRNPTTRPISIVSVESPVASHAMIHETKTESGQSRMRPHEQLVVPPGQTVKLEPGGLHIMLDGITRPERSEGNPEKRQRRDDRSAEKGIPRSASGATRDAGRPTAVGQSVPLVLLLADGNKVQVAAVVRPLTAQ